MSFKMKYFRMNRCALRRDQLGGAAIFSLFFAGGFQPHLSTFMNFETRMGIDPVCFHPAYSIKVGEPFHQPPPGAIFSLSVQSRVMTDGNLDHPIAAHLEQGGQKPVHTLIELQVSNAVATKSFQRAAGVDNVVASHPIAHFVGDPGRNTFPWGVLAVDPYAADHTPIL